MNKSARAKPTAKTKNEGRYVAVRRFWSLDHGRYYNPGDVVPEDVAKKAAKIGLVKVQPDTHEKKENDK